MCEARKTRLLKEFGGIGALKTTSIEDLRTPSWLPEAVAVAVYEALHPDTSGDSQSSDDQSGDNQSSDNQSSESEIEE